MRYDSEFLRLLKEKYPPGTRIRLTKMNDPYAPVPPGTEGTVDFIDDACGIHYGKKNIMLSYSAFSAVWHALTLTVD